MAAVSAELWNATNSALVSTLDDAQGRACREMLSDIGSGRLFLNLDDADRAAMVDGRVVRFLLDAEPVFATLVVPPQTNLVSTEEDPDEGDSFDMPGLLALFERGVVGPEIDSDRPSPRERRFDFTSKYIDLSGWTPAVELKRQGDAGIYGDAPEGWQDPDAMWIASRDFVAGTPLIPPFPVGPYWLHGELDLADETMVGFMFTADDGHDTYVNGEVLASDLAEFAWGKARSAIRILPAGVHYVRVRVENMVRDNVDTNASAYIFAAHEMTDGGKTFGPVLMHSDASWLAVDVGEEPPRLTCGRILRAAVEEVQARGGFVGVTLGFTDDQDSDGNDWSVLVDALVNVADPVLSLIKQLVEQKAIEVRMRPTGLVLDAYNPGGVGAVTAISIERGEHIVSAELEGEETLGTAALYQDERGVWRWREAPTVGDGRIEFGLSLAGAPSEAAGERIVDALFESIDSPTRHASYAIEPEPGATLFVDFIVGSTVDVFTADGAVPIRVEAGTLAEDETGEAVTAIEGRV